MALPITIPFTFGNATTTQSLSSLDTNFTTITNSVNGLTNGASQINVASISATGTANATTYLRGDGAWATVSGGGGSGTVTSINANSTIGFTFTGGPVTTSGTLTLSGPTPGTSGNVLTSNGTVWLSSAGAYPLTSGTAQASTSGTSIDFTSIPSWVKRITVLINGVSTSGTSNLWVQIGSGSVTTSGYTGYYARQGSGGTGYVALASSFILNNAVIASSTFVGSLTLVLISGTTWVGTGITIDSTSINSMGNISGSLALSGALDRIRLTTANGTDTFDAGSINIMYE